jgi:hypothetical protein
MKGAFNFMKKTAICYFCARKLKKIYGFTENDLLKDNFYKNFISTDKDFLQTIGKMKLNTLNS